MAPPPEAQSVLLFWFEETKPIQWFRRDKAFDQLVRTRFGALHQQARTGQLDDWRSEAAGSLALIIILDQVSRNIFRDRPEAFAQDRQAHEAAKDAIKRGFPQQYPAKEQAFFYMPFMHSEDFAAQEECVRLFQENLPDTNNVEYAIKHRDIIARFGRFPHRNKILGRKSTPEETQYMKDGGFNP